MGVATLGGSRQAHSRNECSIPNKPEIQETYNTAYPVKNARSVSYTPPEMRSGSEKNGAIL